MTITNVHFTMISGHFFFANCMFIFHKTEVQTVILRCLTSLILSCYNSFDTKCKKAKNANKIFEQKCKKTKMEIPLKRLKVEILKLLLPLLLLQTAIMEICAILKAQTDAAADSSKTCHFL